jgi:hypothetical protein
MAITLQTILKSGLDSKRILDSDNVALSQYTGESFQEDKLTKKLNDIDAAVSSKQDTIDDLDDIRTKAAAGATAVQPSALTTALASKQDTISDLATIRSKATTAVQPAALNDYAQKSEVPSNTVDLVFTLEGGTQQTIKVYVQE